MASENLERNLDETKERMYEFTYAAAIVDVASTGNRAWLRERIIQAANKYDLDLTEKENVAKAREAYKKAFMEDLVARGILERSGTIGGYVRSNDPGKLKEYNILMFNVRCKNQELQLAKATSKLVKAAMKVKEGTLSFIASELKFGPKLVYELGVRLLTTVATLQSLDKAIDDKLSDVRRLIARDILHMNDEEIVKSVFLNKESEDKDLSGEKSSSHGPEEVIGEFKFKDTFIEKITKESEKKVSDYTKIEGPTVAEAHFTDKDKEKAVKHAHRIFEGEREENESIAKKCGNFMQDIVLNQSEAMINAMFDIDKEVNPSGEIQLDWEKKFGVGLRSAAVGTKLTIPHFISFANAAQEFTKEMTLGTASKIGLLISSLAHKGYDSKSAKIRATARFINNIIYGLDCAASFAAKKLIPVGEFTKAEYDIRHYNIKEIDERKRGENFAKTYASLNVYRAGKAEYITGALGVFRMRPKDCLWAMAYLTAGINATQSGVIYDLPKGGAIGGKQEISEHHDKNLDKKAVALYEKYKNLACKLGYEAALQKAKEEFTEKHHTAVQKSNELRMNRGFDPLNTLEHFNDIYDNAPVREYDYIRVANMTKEEYRHSDIDKVYQEYDAIYLQDEYTGSLFVEGEKRAVSVSLDECNRAVSMDLTNKLLWPNEENARNQKEIKEDFISHITERENELLQHDALMTYAGTFDNKQAGVQAATKWLGISKVLIANKQFIPYTDIATKESGFIDKRTGAEFKFTNCEPSVALNDRCFTMKHFSMDILKKELNEICRTCQIEEQDIHKITDLTKNQSSAERNILARIDKEGLIHDFDSSYRLLKGDLNVKDTIVNVDKRCAAVNHMTELISNKFDEAKEISDNLENELREYQELAQTDPVLALCKTVEPECERHDEFITLKLNDGTEFAINQTNGKLADFCNEMDDTMGALRNEFISILKEARDHGADLLNVPGKDQEKDDLAQEQDIDSQER